MTGNREDRPKLKDLSLEELQALCAELKGIHGRQHGRTGVTFDDPEKEKIRLRNNIASMWTRLDKRNLVKAEEKVFRETYQRGDKEPDQYGISAFDRRRFKGCFKSGYIGAPVERRYVITMTGLTLNQIYILQNETGLCPTPKVTKSIAEADEKHRQEVGDIY